MTLLATVAVNNLPGVTSLGPWTVLDGDSVLTFSFSNWTQVARTAALTVDISLDGAGSWDLLGSMNSAAGGVVKPRGPVSMTMAPLPVLCQCGVYYLPGVAAYDRSLDHSTVTLKAGVTLADLGQLVTRPLLSTAAFRKWILIDKQGRDIDDQYVDRVFHVPSPGANPPRQVRASLTVAGGRVTSTLTVTSV